MKILLIFIIPLFFIMNAQGAIIGSFSNTGGGSSSGTFTELDLDLIFRSGEPGTYVGRLFDSIILKDTDDGMSFFANATTDPFFSAAVSLLTNGVNDEIGIDRGLIGGGSSGVTTSEANWFFNDPTGTNGIDFSGKTINQIELVVNSVDISVTSGITSYSADTTVNIHGTVPIPATVWLFGSGLIGLVGIARRKKA